MACAGLAAQALSVESEHDFPPDNHDMSDAERPKLGRNVMALSTVSFLTDVSSEMIYPLLPVFLTSEIGRAHV